MALYGSNTEYALHCLLYLVPLSQGRALSTRDLAEFQGVIDLNVTTPLALVHHANQYLVTDGYPDREGLTSIVTGYAALDIFMCGAAKPHRAVEVLRDRFKPDHVAVTEHRRGSGL